VDQAQRIHHWAFGGSAALDPLYDPGRAMKLFQLALAYLRHRPLNTFLNVILLALGVAMIVVLLLFSSQMEDRLTRDSRGIDMVVGAKGSPLQLILSSIYQIDMPTGNIALTDALKLKSHPMIKRIVPLALGDAFRGFRIVGTEHSYLKLYDAALAQGELWAKPLDAVLGSQVAKVTGLKIGDTFTGSHGLGAGGGEHEAAPFKVVGILAPTDSVADRLVLTGIDSVWKMHEHHSEKEGDHTESNTGKEVTSLLIQYRTPLAGASLPREINSQSAMQAASPAFETARLLSLVGFGVDTLRAFAIVLMASALLSMFIALTNTLDERRYDLAIMRTLGAGNGWLFALVLLQGMLLAGLGALIGIALGHIAAQALGMWFNITQQMAFTGLTWVKEEWWLIAVAIAVGIVAAILPALRAYRTDIASTLAKE
jgi:putative ABC transport system permease protein